MDVKVGSELTVKYCCSDHGSCYSDRVETITVVGIASDKCFELSNGDHMFESGGEFFIDDMEITRVELS